MPSPVSGSQPWVAGYVRGHLVIADGEDHVREACESLRRKLSLEERASRTWLGSARCKKVAIVNAAFSGEAGDGVQCGVQFENN